MKKTTNLFYAVFAKKRMFGEFSCFNRLFALSLPKESYLKNHRVYRRFEIIEQVLNRNTGAVECGSSAENFFVNVDCIGFHNDALTIFCAANIHTVRREEKNDY